MANYIRRKEDITGKHTAFTEIDINASPEIVRAVFLDFSTWGEWCRVLPEISVRTGDINNLSTKPNLNLTLDFGRKSDPAKAPVYPKVYENKADLFDWGFSWGFLLKANHVFIFESIKGGKATRLVHYEKMQGLMKSLLMTKSTMQNMVKYYDEMNEALKTRCEAAL